MKKRNSMWKRGTCLLLAVLFLLTDKLEAKASSYQLQKKDSGAAVARVLEVYNFEGQDSYYIEFI